MPSKSDLLLCVNLCVVLKINAESWNSDIHIRPAAGKQSLDFWGKDFTIVGRFKTAADKKCYQVFLFLSSGIGSSTLAALAGWSNERQSKKKKNSVELLNVFTGGPRDCLWWQKERRGGMNVQLG